MTKWLDLDAAVELIRAVRKTNVGAAAKLLTVACADGVQARQRPCWEKDDFGLPIPAAAWPGAHLDLTTGELYPAGTDPHNPTTAEGGYGYGGNGIIEINEDDLRAWLRKPAPKKRGRPGKFEDIKQRVFTLLDYHGLPDGSDPQWQNQAAVEAAVLESLDAAESTVREHVPHCIDLWKAEKGGKAGN